MLGDVTGSVQGDVTGSVQGDKTDRIHSKSISKSFFTAVEEVGLYFIPSNSTEIPAGTDDVAGSRTWSDVSSGLYSGKILDTVSFLATSSGSASGVGSGSSFAGVVAMAGTLFSSSL